MHSRKSGPVAEGSFGRDGDTKADERFFGFRKGVAPDCLGREYPSQVSKARCHESDTKVERNMHARIRNGKTEGEAH